MKTLDYVDLFNLCTKGNIQKQNLLLTNFKEFHLIRDIYKNNKKDITNIEVVKATDKKVKFNVDFKEDFDVDSYSDEIDGSVVKFNKSKYKVKSNIGSSQHRIEIKFKKQ